MNDTFAVAKIAQCNEGVWLSASCSAHIVKSIKTWIDCVLILNLASFTDSMPSYARLYQCYISGQIINWEETLFYQRWDALILLEQS